MLESPLLKRFIVVTLILSAMNLYTLNIFPERFRGMLELGAGLLIIAIVVYDLFSQKKHRIKQNFRVEIILFLLATFFSMFMAYNFHNQGIKTTLVVQRFMYFYFFYFFLHSIKIKPDDLEKLIIPFGLLYLSLYFIQYSLLPTRIFDASAGLSRGTLRILIPGMGFAVLSYYKSLQSYLLYRKSKDAILTLLFFTVIAVLQGTRQTLASLTLVTVAYIFFSDQVKSRSFVIILSVVAGLAIFFIFQNIFHELLSVTQRQTTEGKTNIRIIAMIFFITEFMPSWITYIFGNGQDSLNSAFGLQVSYYKVFMGLYQSDVGIIGEYSKFGILYVIGMLSIKVKLIFGKLPKRLTYVRYFMITGALTMLGGLTSFGVANGIVLITLILYLIDCYRNEETAPEMNNDKFINV